ncbi:MAG TPA: hypothetical protein VHC19_02040 [Pirellulales bacterium]|nr:hypothetical protein [Pirellulales bacterium]
MSRPQFSIRTLLWLTLVVAAFLGGIGYGQWRAEQRFSDEIWVDLPGTAPVDGSRIELGHVEVIDMDKSAPQD